MLLVLPLLAACGGKDEPLTPEQQFVNGVYEHIPATKDTKGPVLVEQARVICDYFIVAGVTPISLVQGVDTFIKQSEIPLTIDDAGYFFRASTKLYCPRVGKAMTAVSDQMLDNA